MDTILITGFGAYANTPTNPAEKPALSLDGEEIAGARIVSRIVSGAYFRCIEETVAAMEELKPSAVLMLGEYGGRSMITLERIAQNLNDCARYDVTDTAGVTLQGELTAPDGPVGYYTTVPIRAMTQAMRDAGVPTDISDSAATFCCNHLMYGVLHHIAENKLSVRAGWLHLPHLPEVAAMIQNLGAPSMSVDTLVKGMRAGIEALQENSEDQNINIISKMLI
ncbi:Pyrrolidone-carboxylate peptidase [Pseudovibrio axinellae]|uniref:Pyroglutamyl-peptidase I n=1 Tax=Pseudovibrio axinellae TaxID=989403 RepID=A0A165ZA60_9HYPH|nr:pyroglutamyl-peptidase I [Pseudovibrio axinellae]KZL19645.1 Pyrrolidone-carboxylate peptidase [Pseudovibrio axinellae]SEQ35364.1 pyroglutamyl-peptidase I Cysteine peptidase. MEROPS family C15 [Pseudovibrio axinellae]